MNLRRFPHMVTVHGAPPPPPPKWVVRTGAWRRGAEICIWTASAARAKGGDVARIDIGRWSLPLNAAAPRLEVLLLHGPPQTVSAHPAAGSERPPPPEGK